MSNASSSQSSPSSPHSISPQDGSTEDNPSSFSYKRALQREVFEDLESRFIINLPPEELLSPERISFQIEQAHWYYEDFVRPENPKLPSYSMKDFSAALIRHVAQDKHLLTAYAKDPNGLYEKFLRYKARVPVCGAIMLNDTWDECVIVRGYTKNSGWGFPKGKINENEPLERCAQREVYEETGYLLKNETAINPKKCIQKSMKGQQITLFIVPNVPMDYQFQTRTRKEIGRIDWIRLSNLPGWSNGPGVTAGKFYLIMPFISELEKFVHDHRPSFSPSPHGQLGATRNGHHKQSESPEPCDTNSDHAQESSSQSSTNGGPDTPSPHYTNLLPNVVEPQGASDPAMSRLLSQLSMSAQGGKSKSTVSALSAPLISGTSACGETVEPSAPGGERRSKSRVSARMDPHILGTAGSQVVQQPEQRERSVTATNSDETVTGFRSLTRVSRSSNPTSPTLMASSPSNRSGQFAPGYRPAPDREPNSKALALLQTISTEAERMSEFMNARQELTPSLTPSPRFLSQQADVPRGFYSSQPLEVFYSSGQPLPDGPPMGYPPQLYDVPRPATTFPGLVHRPSTSQLYHRPGSYHHSSAMSMSHSQFQDIAHPVQPLPPFPGRPMYTGHPDPRGSYPPLSQPTFGPGNGHPPFPPFHAQALVPANHPLPPLSAPAYPPTTFDSQISQPPARPGTSAPRSLLSLLNNAPLVPMAGRG